MTRRFATDRLWKPGVNDELAIVTLILHRTMECHTRRNGSSHWKCCINCAPI